MKVLTAFFTVFILFLSSCEEEKDVRYLYLSEDFKKWSLFSKGTYWIYLNEANGNSDSSYVVEDPSRYWTENHTKDAVILLEYYTYQVNGRFLSQQWVDQSGGEMERWYNVLPDTSYAMLISEGYSWFNSEFISELTLNGVKYENVVHFKGYLYPDSKPVVQTWVAREVGVIKYVMETGAVDSAWSLIRYHIVQNDSL